MAAGKADFAVIRLSIFWTKKSKANLKQEEEKEMGSGFVAGM